MITTVLFTKFDIIQSVLILVSTIDLHKSIEVWLTLTVSARKRCKMIYIFAVQLHCQCKHAHRLVTNVTKVIPQTAIKNPTIACGPTAANSSPLIGIHTNAANDATK